MPETFSAMARASISQTFFQPIGKSDPRSPRWSFSTKKKARSRSRRETCRERQCSLQPPYHRVRRVQFEFAFLSLTAKSNKRQPPFPRSGLRCSRYQDAGAKTRRFADAGEEV